MLGDKVVIRLHPKQGRTEGRSGAPVTISYTVTFGDNTNMQSGGSPMNNDELLQRAARYRRTAEYIVEAGLSAYLLKLADECEAKVSESRKQPGTDRMQSAA